MVTSLYVVLTVLFLVFAGLEITESISRHHRSKKRLQSEGDPDTRYDEHYIFQEQ